MVQYYFSSNSKECSPNHRSLKRIKIPALVSMQLCSMCLLPLLLVSPTQPAASARCHHPTESQIVRHRIVGGLDASEREFPYAAQVGQSEV